MNFRVEIIGDATLYLADCKDVLSHVPQSAVLVCDPPYGINYVVNARSWQNEGLDALKPYEMAKRPAIVGDDAPFSPSHLLGFERAAIFGANHMDGLPAGGRWIVWDKRRESTPDSHSDCEFVWTNVPGASRIHRQKWRGIVREGEENISRSRKLHSNQKPVALLERVFDEIGVRPGDVIFDPYMGSGSTGVVALRRGLQFIGVEIDPTHFETARIRLESEQRAIPSQKATP